MNNDLNLFEEIVLSEQEFDEWIAPLGKYGGGREFTQIWQSSKFEFQKMREEQFSQQFADIDISTYRVLSGSIDPESGFIEFDFKVDDGDGFLFRVSLYMAEVAHGLAISESSDTKFLTSMEGSRWKVIGIRR